MTLTADHSRTDDQRMPLWWWCALVGAIALYLWCISGCSTPRIVGKWYDAHGNIIPDPDCGSMGASSSWGTLRIMALGLFFPAVGLLVAGLTIMPLLLRPAITMIACAAGLAAVPFALEWLGKEASLPVEIGMFAALALGIAWTVRKFFLAKAASKATGEVAVHMAAGNHDMAAAVQKKAAKLTKKARSLI